MAIDWTRANRVVAEEEVYEKDWPCTLERRWKRITQLLKENVWQNCKQIT